MSTDSEARPPTKRRWALPRRPLGRVGTRIAVFIIAAFVLNYWLASRSLSEPPLVRVPYSPLFLEQVRDGNVARITSKGPSIQGVFREAVTYPSSSSKETVRFRTEVPSF